MASEEQRLDGVDVIYLTGYARSGKDTLARVLQNYAGFYRDYHAKPIYEMLATMFATSSDSDMRTVLPRLIEAKENGHDWFIGDGTPINLRHALQTLGTEWGRRYIHDSVWAMLLFDRLLTEAANGQERFVITDCRFINEWEYALRVIERPRLVAVVSDRAVPQTHHASEQEVQQLIQQADYVITNNGEMSDLMDKAADMCNHFGI